MAQHALPPGAIRRRAIFGLLDADGWGYAGLKATFWFLFTIFMLGYIPNLAYYFTVSNTVKVGYNFLSIVNWCPTQNVSLPCPAPVGAVVPWQVSPPELALPQTRSSAAIVQSGTHLYLVGGVTPAGTVADTLQTTVSLDGNFSTWTPGPALPAPRSGAAVATLSGIPYVIGGIDASGQPTKTVYRGTIDNGVLTGWVLADGTNKTTDLTLPEAISDASAVASSTGLFVLGGLTPDLSAKVWHSQLSKDALPVLSKWQEMATMPLPAPRADAAAVAIGNFFYVVGGQGPTGPTATIFRLPLAGGAPAVDPATGQSHGWDVSPVSQNLPTPRFHSTGFAANGSLYVAGGTEGAGPPLQDFLWAIPDTTTGDLGPWQHLDQTQLPEGRARSSLAAVGSFAFLIAGDGPSGPVDSTFRANLSPAPPFFQLGIAGATIPALSIKGEIGQQLGYINAMTVGMVNFVVLVAIALAFSHRRQTLRLFERLSGGRFRAPPEDDFGPPS